MMSLVKWLERQLPSAAPASPLDSRRKLLILRAILLSCLGYHIPIGIGLISVAIGYAPYGWSPLLIMYAGMLVLNAIFFLTTLHQTQITKGFVLFITVTQLSVFLALFSVYVFVMEQNRSISLLMALLAFAHMFTIGELITSLVLSTIAVIVYCTVGFLAATYFAQPFDFVREIVFIITFIAVSIYIAYMGINIRRSRDQVREVKRSLEATQKDLRSTMKRLEQAAATDVLTGLLNRRAANEVLREAQEKVASNDFYATVLLLDIDNFKSINDAHGHECGDLVLKLVADVFRNFARDEDMVVRWGGEEFLVLYNHTHLEAAVEITERLRHQLASMSFAYGDVGLAVTFSGGLAELLHQRSLNETLALADKRLYQAKRAGRNRVISECQDEALSHSGEGYDPSTSSQ